LRALRHRRARARSVASYCSGVRNDASFCFRSTGIGSTSTT
jgi:hypothetical protein